MSEIARNWNGNIFGTNTGKVALSLDGDNAALTGIIRVADDQHGLSIFKVTGAFADGKIALKGTVDPATQQPGVQYGEITVEGALTPQGRVDGKWSSTLGTGGTFQLYPHDLPALPAGAPELDQLHTVVRTLGAVRLYSDSAKGLLNQVARDFNIGRPVVTYVARGSERTIYADEFVQIIDTLPELHFLKIGIQEHEQNGINRVVNVELTSNGENLIRVQSVQDSWAVGKAETLSGFLRDYQHGLATQFRKFGLSLNVAISIVALAALPGLSGFWRRLAFAGSVVGLQGLVTFLHKKFVPNFVLSAAKENPSFWSRAWPGVVSWLLAIVGTVIGAIIYGLLKGELDGSPLMLSLHNVLGIGPPSIPPK